MLASIIIFSILILGSMHGTILDQKRNELRRYAHDIALLYTANAQTAINSTDRSNIKSPPLASLQSMTNAYIYYDGLPIYNQDQPPAPPDEIRKKLDLKGTGPEYISWETRGGAKYEGYVEAVEIANERVGTIVVARESSTLSDEWTLMIAAFCFSGLVIVIWSYIISENFTKRISNPILQIVEAAEQISQGNYDVKIIELEDSSQEISTLAQSFNDMANELLIMDERDKNFFMSISHELKTPLTKISGHAKLIRDRSNKLSAEEKKQSLEAIVKASDSLNRLISDIIDLARMRGGRFQIEREAVKLHELLGAIAAEWTDSRLSASDIIDATACIDPMRLEQVIHNILSNAGRYAKTQITLTTRKTANQMYEIIIANDGDPVPLESVSKLFRPFFSEQKKGSMGLGLAISQELMKKQDGDIIYREIDRRPTFIITLPLSENAR